MSINTFEQQQVNFKIFPVEHSWVDKQQSKKTPELNAAEQTDGR